MQPLVPTAFVAVGRFVVQAGLEGALVLTALQLALVAAPAVLPWPFLFVFLQLVLVAAVGSKQLLQLPAAAAVELPALPAVAVELPALPAVAVELPALPAVCLLCLLLL